MKYVTTFKNNSALRAVVIHDLRSCGIIVSEKTLVSDCLFESGSSQIQNNSIFGRCLCHVPTYEIAQYGPVPCFLVETIGLLQNCQHVEGLFRLSGSAARQKELKQRLDEGYKLPDTAAPHDLACLLKQFIREIPHSLIPVSVHDVMVQCCQINPAEKQLHYLLLASLLLPRPCIIALRFILNFLWSLSLHSRQNRMDISNLVVCLAPNIFHSWFSVGCSIDSAIRQRTMQAQNDMLRILIENATQVGMVTESVCEKMAAWSSYFSSDDERENDEGGERLHVPLPEKKQKKTRRGSLKGLMTSLSSSFSRWRRDSKGHNDSDVSGHVSTLSCPNIGPDDTADENGNGQLMCGTSTLSMVDYMPADVATPKLMQKRKGDDSIAFSASKRRAILQNMPNMSLLAGSSLTPFTPVKRDPDEGDLSTESTDKAAGCGTPRHTLEKLLSSPSRKSRRKSGRFTPSKRRSSICGSVVKFLRRMSGSKDPSETNQDGTGSPLLVSGEVADAVFVANKKSHACGKLRDGAVQLLAATSIPSQSGLHAHLPFPDIASSYRGKTNNAFQCPNVSGVALAASVAGELATLCSHSNNASMYSSTSSMDKFGNFVPSGFEVHVTARPNGHSEDSMSNMLSGWSEGSVNKLLGGEDAADGFLDGSLHDEAFLEQSLVSIRDADCGIELGDVEGEEDSIAPKSDDARFSVMSEPFGIVNQTGDGCSVTRNAVGENDVLEGTSCRAFSLDSAIKQCGPCEEKSLTTKSELHETASYRLETDTENCTSGSNDLSSTHSTAIETSAKASQNSSYVSQGQIASAICSVVRHTLCKPTAVLASQLSPILISRSSYKMACELKPMHEQGALLHESHSLACSIASKCRSHMNAEQNRSILKLTNSYETTSLSSNIGSKTSSAVSISLRLDGRVTAPVTSCGVLLPNLCTAPVVCSLIPEGSQEQQAARTPSHLNQQHTLMPVAAMVGLSVPDSTSSPSALGSTGMPRITPALLPSKPASKAQSKVARAPPKTPTTSNAMNRSRFPK